MLNNVFCSNELFSFMFSIDYIFNFLQIKLFCNKTYEVHPDHSEIYTLQILVSGMNFKKKQRSNFIIKLEERLKQEKLNINRRNKYYNNSKHYKKIENTFNDKKIKAMKGVIEKNYYETIKPQNEISTA